MLAFTPEGTGTAARRALEAGSGVTRRRFSTRIRVRRTPGYHAGAGRAPGRPGGVLRDSARSGRFAVPDRELSARRADAIAMRRPVALSSCSCWPRSPPPAGRVPTPSRSASATRRPECARTGFARLDIRRVRLLVSTTSVLRGDYSRYDAWMQGARARRRRVAHDQPQLRAIRRLPTVRQYRRIVRALRAHYPWVHTMAAWNEANHVRSRPTATRAAPRSTTTRCGRSAPAARSSPPTCSTRRTCCRGSRSSSATRSTRGSGACTPTRTPTTSGRSTRPRRGSCCATCAAMSG